MRLLICLAPLIGCAAPAAAEAPAKLYTPLPAPMRYAPIDPPLEALRGRLREIVARKDLAALRAHVIAKGFFWENDWDFMFEAGKPSFDNFVLAYNLDTGLGTGWDDLQRAATETIATRHASRPGVICLPARPPASPREIKAHARTMGVDPLMLVYPRTAPLPVYEKPEPGARVIDTIGGEFVRRLDWATKDGANWTVASSWFEIVTPAGKRAFAAPGTLDAYFYTQTCFAKDPTGAWKIAGTASY